MQHVKLKKVPMKLKHIIKDLFTTTRAERNGGIVLSAILVILILVRFILPGLLTTKEKNMDLQQLISEIQMREDSLRQIAPAFEHEQHRKVSGTRSSAPEQIEYFEFDPNDVTLEQLVKLGIAKRTANTFINFRSHGAVFREPEDILKVYGIDSAIYRRIKPYIKIAPKEIVQVHEIYAEREQNKIVAHKSEAAEEEPSVTKPKPVTELVLIEINSADSALFTTLRGIGPVYARRIVNFRNSLGGFHCITQLKEVYNFPEETYQNIEDKLCVDSTKVKKININFAEIGDLRSHPYCNYSMARAIVDYRTKNGSYKHLEQLVSDTIINHDDFERLSAYLTIR